MIDVHMNGVELVKKFMKLESTSAGLCVPQWHTFKTTKDFGRSSKPHINLITDTVILSRRLDHGRDTVRIRSIFMRMC